MRLPVRRLAGVAALLLAACDGPATGVSDKPDAPSEDADPPGPCADGTWMGASSPAGLVFVRADATGGDGAVATPYGTLREALDAVAPTGGTVAVYPGTYAGAVVLRADVAPLALAGCGEETLLTGVAGGGATVALEGAFATTLRAVAITGGSPGVAIRAGGTGTVEDVTIAGTNRVGLQVAGPTTVATVRRLTIADAARPGLQRGWGVSLADGTLTLEDSSIAAQVGYGLYAERGTLVATGVDIAGNAEGPVAGVYAHAMDAVTLDDVAVSGAAGVGIHLYEIGATTIRGCAVTDTRAGRWRGSGDGILVRQGARPFSSVAIEGNTVARPARLGIAVDGGDVTLDANTITGGVTTGGTSLWATPGTNLRGDSAAELDVSLFPIGREEHPLQGPRDFGRPGSR